MKQTTPLFFAVKYGLITGGSISAFQLLFFLFGMMNVLPKFIILTWLAFALGSYLAVREYRTLAGNGFVKYGKAYRTALLTFTVTGLICAFYTYILYKFLLLL